jgi:hypothetical protein
MSTEISQGQGNNGNNGNNNNGNNKRRKKNQALHQQKYREKLRQQGYRQLNIVVPSKYYVDLQNLIRLEEERLEEILKLVNENLTNNNFQTKPKETLITKNEKPIEISVNEEIIEDMFYTGNFSARLKIFKEHYKIVAGTKIPATQEEVKAAESYIKKIEVILNENKELPTNALSNVLHEKGYYTFNKDNQKIRPSVRGVKTIQQNLLQTS